MKCKIYVGRARTCLYLVERQQVKEHCRGEEEEKGCTAVAAAVRGDVKPRSDIRPCARQASIASRQATAASRAADLLPTIRELQAQGITSLAGLAKALTNMGITTARGGSTWTPIGVSRVLAKAQG